MKKTLALLLLSIPASLPGQRFASDFRDKTMRIDYFHTGGMGSEIVSVDRIVSDGPWPGSTTHLLDSTGLGKYRFEVQDSATGRPLFSKGLASIYGEWETTDEAARTHKTFSASLRFPWPLRPVKIRFEKRDSTGKFAPLTTFDVNPSSSSVNSADIAAEGRPWTLWESGPAHSKVDLVILGEGYTETERAKFHRDARRLVAKLFEKEPFKSRKSDFNVRAIDLASAQSGVSQPQKGRYRRTATSTDYNVFGSERYVLSLDNRRLRDVLSAVPYDFVEIIVNDKQYGGGGIFNEHSTVSADTEYAPYIFVHEFAHHMAGLADEYYTSPVAYTTGGAILAEPWEPNATALRDTAKLKWKPLVKPGTPLPTQWDKLAFEKATRPFVERRAALIARNAPEAEFDKLFHEQEVVEQRLLRAMANYGRTGAFEGASYEARGLYRPEIDCIMFTRSADHFCAVCREWLARIISLYSS
jgi:hypothetical protein